MLTQPELGLRTLATRLVLAMFVSIVLTGVPCEAGILTCVAGGSSTTTECWNTTTQRWQNNPTLIYSVESATAFNFGKISCLAGGGPNSYSSSQAVWCTNGSGWYVMPSLVSSRTGAAPLYLGSSVGIVGGASTWETAPTTGATQVFPLATFSWTSLPNVPSWSITNPNVFTLNGTACVYWIQSSWSQFGYQTTQYTSCLSGSGTLSSQSWVTGPNPTATRSEALTIFASGQYCLVGGGATSVDCISAASTVSTGSFSSSVPATASGLLLSANATIYGMPCVTGGGTVQYMSVSSTNAVTCLNSSAKVAMTKWNWVTAPALLSARYAHASFTLDDSPITLSPTRKPTKAPVTHSPTLAPSTPTIPNTSPTPKPSVAPSVAPSHFPTTSPTPAPTNSPTFSPSLSPSLSPTYSPSTRSPTTSPSRAPTPIPAETNVESAREGESTLIVTGVNGTDGMGRAHALLVIQEVLLQLGLVNASIDPKLISVQPDSSHPGTSKTFVITVVISDELGSRIQQSLSQNPLIQVQGSTVGVELTWPSLFTAIAALPPSITAILIAVAVLVLILLVGVHLYRRVPEHLPSLLGLFTSTFSFISHAWFLSALYDASISSGSPIQRQTFRPYYIAFFIALLLPLLVNGIMLVIAIPPIRRNDSDFSRWLNIHPVVHVFVLFLGLVSAGNVAVVSSPLWWFTAAPMTKITKIKLATIGLPGTLLELPRLLVQVVLAVLHTSSSIATVVPLCLGSLFFSSGLLMRCYNYGYLRDNRLRGNTEGPTSSMYQHQTSAQSIQLKPQPM